MIEGDFKEDLRGCLREKDVGWAGSSWDEEEDASKVGENWEPVESEWNSECDDEDEDIVIPDGW